MKNFRSLLVQVLGWINFVNIFALLLIVLWQVFSRYVLNDPSTVSEELARIFLMWLGPLGAAYALAFNEHMAIDLLSQKLDEKQQRILRKVILIFCGFLSLIFFNGGFEIVKESLALKQTTAALGLPMGYVYLAVPIGAFFMLALVCIDFISEGDLPNG